VLSILGAIWFWRNGEAVITRLFPHLEFERGLGWLNQRSTRRAERILCGLTHLLHVALLVALAGILALSWNLGQPVDADNARDLLALAGEGLYLIVCCGLWIYYFAAILAPRLRAEYEAAELARYRAENPEEPTRPKRVDRLGITLWELTPPRRF
jgi:hypothetical protein